MEVAAPMPDEAPVMTATGVDLFVRIPPSVTTVREIKRTLGADAGSGCWRRSGPADRGRCNRDVRTQYQGGHAPSDHDPAPSESACRVPERPIARCRPIRVEPEDATGDCGRRPARELAAGTRAGRCSTRSPHRG